MRDRGGKTNIIQNRPDFCWCLFREIPPVQLDIIIANIFDHLQRADKVLAHSFTQRVGLDPNLIDALKRSRRRLSRSRFRAATSTKQHHRARGAKEVSSIERHDDDLLF